MADDRTITRHELELLLAMLDHEVRTPLSALVGFVELLRPDMSARELNEVVQRIKSNARALSEVIDTLPDLPKLEWGKPRVEETPFDLLDLIDDLVGSFKTEANRKRIELAVDVDPRIPSILRGARGRVRQVLANLLSNALKFTERGRIHLRFEQVDATEEAVQLRYSVVDTGRGIPADVHEQILEPFVRVEEAGDSTTMGGGLGLSICVTLLEAMGSRIELDSDPGKGSAFSFVLVHARPVEAREGSSKRGPEVSSESTDVVRVLIADDDEDNLELLGQLVRREGFAVDLVRDGHAALSMIDRREYALLITDLRMSGMDGFELSRRLREREARTQRPAMPIVAITAGSLLRDDPGRTIEDRFDAILLKPVRPRVLARLLEPHKVSRALPETPIDTAVVSLVPDYLARRNDDLRVVRKFLSGHASIEMVATIGHNLKGTALSYGFPRLGELGAALEEAASANQVQRIAGLVDTLEQVIDEARTSGQATSEMKRLVSSGTGRVPIRHS